ncbi:MAG: hypothetical protein AAF092_10515 [Pseudomonadota bacterium]
MIKLLMGALGFGGKVYEARQKLKVAKLEAEAVIATKRADSDAAWEGRAAQNAATSWLDEYWTVILSLPLIAAFVGFNDFVEAGFENLEGAPAWYQWAVLASISFAFARKTIPSLRFGGKS